MTSIWDKRFVMLAKHVATWSKDPSTKVGAVIVDPMQRVVSLGFNGLPRGVSDDDRLHDRTMKYEMIVHAEVNALLFTTTSLAGCTLYTWPMPPCSRCAAQVIQSGIKRVVSPAAEERWSESCGLGGRMLHEAGVSTFTCEGVIEPKAIPGGWL